MFRPGIAEPSRDDLSPATGRRPATLLRRPEFRLLAPTRSWAAAAGRSARSAARRFVGAVVLGVCCSCTIPYLPPPPPPPFPGPNEFIGSYDPRKADARNGAQSTYSGVIAVSMMDASDVEQVLPVGLRLAGQASGSTKHPVIYLTGLQGDPLGLAAGKTYPIIGAKPYEEVIFLVPFVVRTTGTEKWHTFVMRMFLTDAGAVVIGNGVYGYAKKHAKVELTGTPPALSTRASAHLLAIPYFASNATASGAWQPAGSAALPRWSDLREIMEMPVVGVVGPKLVCSYFEWDYGKAEVAAATSMHRYRTPFVGGMADWVAMGPQPSAPGGTVAVRKLRWRLSLDLKACSF